jgi:nicotinamide riboside kinase
MSGSIIALLGAESTGKTTLAAALSAALRAAGHDACAVEETLREFCEREARTPRRDEQAALAAEHARRIEAAAARHAIVVADTTALQTAVYSEQVFGDRSLYAAAEAWHREHVQLTLLCALDLPWRADGLQRDGPQVRAPVDALLRDSLQRAGIAFAIVSGHGPDRLAAALAVVHRAFGWPAGEAEEEVARVGWRCACERCGDPDCERRLLAQRG